MRRVFLALSLLVVEASAGWAQPAHPPRVAFVLIGTEESSKAGLSAFRRGLADYGFEEQRNVVIERRYANGRADRYTELFTELASKPVDIFMAAGFEGILAAQAAANGRPVLAFFCGNDVNQMVASFARPGGNVTGVACLSDELAQKRVELLSEAVTGLKRVGYLYNSEVPGKDRERRAVEAAGARLGLAIVPTNVRQGADIAAAIAALADGGIRALVVAEDLFTYGNRELIVAAATARGLSGVFSNRDFVLAGGLISYGAKWDERIRQYGRYLGRLLQGVRPQELPIDLPTKFELVINLKTARALGLTIPPSILARADEVIE